MSNFWIGSHEFRDNKASQSPYILAEIGLNHNGDIGLASEMVSAAADSGVNGVKFQSYFTEEFLRPSLTDAYQIFKSCELSPDEFEQLKTQAEGLGLNFISTPLTYSYVKILNQMDVVAFKVASCDMTYYDLIEEITLTGKPVIISTGMSLFSEIKDLMSQDFLKDYPVILLHCISNYPPKLEDVHLRTILSFQDEFKVPIGLSDHTLGTAVGIGATALGVQFIEKHFTIDRNLAGPDQKMSMLPEDMKRLVNDSNDLYRALGQKGRPELTSEKDVREIARRGLYARQSIAIGDILGNENAVFLRPPNSVDSRNVRLNKRVFKANESLEGEICNTQINP